MCIIQRIETNNSNQRETKMTYKNLKADYQNGDMGYIGMATEAQIDRLIKETGDDDIFAHYENALEEIRILTAEFI